MRSVDVHEHPQLLAKALNGAKKRLLIIAPWVKGGVVSTDFVAALERRLRAGVEVRIGHGCGPDDSGSDDFALRKLTNLAARYDKLRVVRLQNTHAEILIFDDQWITTSFNWLSFKGDPNRTYRMEEGSPGPERGRQSLRAVHRGVGRRWRGPARANLMGGPWAADELKS